MSEVTKYREPQVRRLLGAEPCEVIDRLGLQAVAVETVLPRPTGQPGGRPIPGRALVCRLYPKTDLARTLFARSGYLRGDARAEAIVFWDPGDDLEELMLLGFHNATIQAKQLLQPDDTGPPPGPDDPRPA